MVGDASKSSTGLGKRKVFHKLPDARWHALRREKGIAKISHGHDHIVGKPWHIRMVFCVKRDYYSDGGEDCSV